MKAQEDITLFDEAEQMAVAFDSIDIFASKNVDEKGIFSVYPIAEQNPFLIRSFMQPYEIFWKEYVTLFLPKYSRYTGPF